ncbi:hypothetical protein GCM10009834_07960 [Streptomonospora arabica]
MPDLGERVTRIGHSLPDFRCDFQPFRRSEGSLLSDMPDETERVFDGLLDLREFVVEWVHILILLIVAWSRQ